MFKRILYRYLDAGFLTHRRQYLLQCAVATLATFIILTVLRFANNELVIASIASTSFVLFTVPHHPFSRFKFVMGGYAIGMITGFIGYELAHVLLAMNDSIALHHFFMDLMGALAVGLSISLMVLFNLKHPPASGVSLSMVVYPWTIKTLVVTFMAVFILSLVRYLLRHWLVDMV